MFQRRKTKSIHSKNTRDDFRKKYKSQRGGRAAEQVFPVANLWVGVTLLAPESPVQLLAGAEHLQSLICGQESSQPREAVQDQQFADEGAQLIQQQSELTAQERYNLVRLVRLNLSDNQLVRLSSELELLSNLEYLNVSR